MEQPTPGSTFPLRMAVCSRRITLTVRQNSVALRMCERAHQWLHCLAGRKTRESILASMVTLVGCASCAAGQASSSSAPPIPPGHAQVARLPDGGGLQYCINLRAGDLAPRGARNVFVHSLSAYVSTTSPTDPALLAITGRYPGWDTPGTTIYNQPFTDPTTNTVWLEIIHEFPLGMACMEVYGRHLVPSRYALFDYKILVGYTYLPPHGPGLNTTKLFPVRWGRYLPRFSPRHRPKH